MAWCTAEQVKKITGKRLVEDEDGDCPALDQAIGHISLKVGLDPELTPNIIGHDGRYIRMACAYQAAWVQDQIDLYERMNTTNVSQDGQSLTWGPDGLTLAPLATAALKNLSWKGTHSTSHAPRDSSADNEDPNDLDGRGRPQKWEPIQL